MDDLIALKIDYKYIYYKCDNCIKINKRILSSNTKKKDKIFANYHICNSYNDLSNRQIRIKSNCIYAQQEFINLHITNNTLKIK